MKRTIILFVVALLVLVTIVLWIMDAQLSWNIREVLMVVCGIILVVFAVYKGTERLKSLSRKEPPEDELSRRIMTKASSISYYISIYLWLFIMYISDRVKWETHTLIGVGILGMALILLFSWLGIKFFGLKDE